VLYRVILVSERLGNVVEVQQPPLSSILKNYHLVGLVNHLKKRCAWRKYLPATLASCFQYPQRIEVRGNSKLALANWSPKQEHHRWLADNARFHTVLLYGTEVFCSSHRLFIIIHNLAIA